MSLLYILIKVKNDQKIYPVSFAGLSIASKKTVGLEHFNDFPQLQRFALRQLNKLRVKNKMSIVTWPKDSLWEFRSRNTNNDDNYGSAPMWEFCKAETKKRFDEIDEEGEDDNEEDNEDQEEEEDEDYEDYEDYGEDQNPQQDEKDKDLDSTRSLDDYTHDQEQTEKKRWESKHRKKCDKNHKKSDRVPRVYPIANERETKKTIHNKINHKNHQNHQDYQHQQQQQYQDGYRANDIKENKHYEAHNHRSKKENENDTDDSENDGQNDCHPKKHQPQSSKSRSYPMRRQSYCSLFTNFKRLFGWKENKNNHKKISKRH